MIDPSELLSVVDESNNPLTPLPRSVAHKKNLWHRTTGIWVLNKDKQILCQKRSMQKDVNPGKWEAFFGGHLAPNEDPTESAAREVSEELGLSVNSSQLIPYSRALKSDKPTHREFQYIFTISLNGGNKKFDFEKEEIDELKWIDLEKVREILTDPKIENWVKINWDNEVLNWLKAL